MKKRKLSKQQEFEVFKLVLDKFLWLGVLVMLYGFYKMVEYADVESGAWYMAAGGVVLLTLLLVLVREYEFAVK